jgi:hypothetical protein
MKLTTIGMINVDGKNQIGMFIECSKEELIEHKTLFGEEVTIIQPPAKQEQDQEENLPELLSYLDPNHRGVWFEDENGFWYKSRFGIKNIICIQVDGHRFYQPKDSAKQEQGNYPCRCQGFMALKELSCPKCGGQIYWSGGK